MRRQPCTVLWMGPVADEATMLTAPAVSPAANRWQSGLLAALQARGALRRVLAHVPVRAWPRGPLRSPGARIGATWGHQLLSSVRTWNPPGLRDAGVAASLWKALQRELERQPAAGAVLLTYNAPPAYTWIARRAQARYGVRWVPVIADVPDGAAAHATHEERLAASDGRVYLSWSAHQERRGGPKLHLDGGVNAIRPASAARQPPTFVFTGALSRYAGVDLAVQAFSSMPQLLAELWVCGKGRNELLEDAARRDPRIRTYGVLPEADLERVASAAAAFVNPRPPELLASAHNFPSKVLEYLSYGRPVISTWTPGLAPEYRDVLVVSGATPEAFASCMQDVLRWDPGRCDQYRHRAEAFLRTRTWDAQAERLLAFLTEEVLSG